MSDTADMALVREYTTQHSEAAFETLIRRHVGLVYAVALRRTGNAAHAEEITQAVFLILARKAARMRPDTILAAWLHETARYVSGSFLRGEARRIRREQEAFMQSNLQGSSNDDSGWKQLAPLLDEAIGHLGKADRNAVVLRFFQNKTAREIAAVLNVQEAAAQKRVNRAVEKLRAWFLKRGVAVSTDTLTNTLASCSVPSAPAHLAASIMAASAKGTVTSGSTLTLIKGALKIMAWTKAKTTIVVGAVLIFSTATTVVTVREVEHQKKYSWEVRNFNFTALEQARPQVAIVPAKYPASAGGWGQEYAGIMGLNQPALEAVKLAYGDSPRIIFSPGLSADLPKGFFDFISHSGRDDSKALQQELERKFFVVSKHETRETDGLLLEVQFSNAPRLKPNKGARARGSGGRGHIGGTRLPLSILATGLESYLHIPVVDRTGLAGNFDYDLNWDDGHGAEPHNPDDLTSALLNQLGLRLVPSRESIEMLVVEKAE